MIVRKVLLFIAVSTLSFMLFVATAFASPSLSDSTITFSVSGRYTQYASRTTFENAAYITSDGTYYVSQDTQWKLSDPFSVIPGGSVFMYRADTYALLTLRHVVFYDSNGSVVQPGFDDANNIGTQFVTVPSGASTARISYKTAISLSNANNVCRVVASPTVVNQSNYTMIWTQLENVTIDSDGVINIPYQVNSYYGLVLDFRFYDSTYQFSTLSFTSLITYTGGYFTGERSLVYGSHGINVDSYFIDEGIVHYDGSIAYSTSNNPFTCYAQIPYERFSGFRIEVDLDPGMVSTALHVKISDFELDGVGTAIQLEADDAINELDRIGNQLDLATPDVSQIYNNLNNVVVQLDDSNFGAFDWFGPTNGIFITMCVTSFTFAALAYILFGKRG